MTNSYRPSVQVRNMGLFRSGQDFDYDDLEYIADREIIAEFLIYDLVERAIGKGFNLKQEEEDHKSNDEIQTEILPIYEDYKISCQKQRLFGKMVNEIQEANEKLYLNTFDPRDFNIELDMLDNITKLGVTEKIENFTTEGDKTLEERAITDFKDIFFTYRKGKRARNKGKSYLESTYDALVGIQNLQESCVYFVIRVGAGLKIIHVPFSKMADDEYMDELEDNIRTMNAENTTMILGYDDATGQKQEVQLLTGQPIDFNTLLVFYYKFISIKSGVPVTILEGVTPGQLEGGKINETLLFDVLAKIQKECEEFLRWIIDKIALFKEIDLGDYQIEWITREAVDEVGKQDLLTKRLTNFITARNDIGLKFDIAAKMAELKIKETDLDPIKVAEKQKLMDNLFNEPTDEDNEDEQESTDTEEDTDDEEDEEKKQ